MSEEHLIESMDEELKQEEENEENKSELQPETDKDAENRKKAGILWSSVVNEGQTNTLLQKVAHIMNVYNETRESDVVLQMKFWEVFEGYDGGTITQEDMFKNERLTSITRARQKIQNEYKLFGSSNKTFRRRRAKEEIDKEIQILNKPTTPIIHIYADETGKTAKYLMVGSVWVLDSKRNGELNSALTKWSAEKRASTNNFPTEFHFKNMKSHELDIYKEFVDQVMLNGDMLSFKAIAVNKQKIRENNTVILKELFYQLVRLGVEHEKNTNRITLPKEIDYIKDEETNESSLDLELVRQNIVDNLKSNYQDELRLNYFQSVNSKLSRMIQVADLFSASLNRKMNVENNDQRNHKDELADYIFSLTTPHEIKSSTEYFDQWKQSDVNITDSSVIYIFD